MAQYMFEDHIDILNVVKKDNFVNIAYVSEDSVLSNEIKDMFDEYECDEYNYQFIAFLSHGEYRYDINSFDDPCDVGAIVFTVVQT